MPPVVEHREVILHDRRMAWLEAGEGEPIVLLHGVTMSPERWGPLLPRLAAHGRVIAPALPGHGRSSKARGDYSVSGIALAVRDLLMMLDVERATVIGHSLGGGITMQLAYVMPELVGRQILVCSGGLGRDLSPYLRLVTLPGASLGMPLVLNRFTRRLFSLGSTAAQLAGAHAAAEVFEGLTRLAHPPSRRAFHAIMGSSVGPEGQRVTAGRRLELAAVVPSMVMWGARDAIIPVSHAKVAHESLPGSRLEVFENAGHFPFLDDPDRFEQVVLGFMRDTEPASQSLADVRDMLQGRGTLHAVS